jgi:hypothetical protein
MFGPEEEEEEGIKPMKRFLVSFHHHDHDDPSPSIQVPVEANDINDARRIAEDLLDRRAHEAGERSPGWDVRWSWTTEIAK